MDTVLEAKIVYNRSSNLNTEVRIDFCATDSDSDSETECGWFYIRLWNGVYDFHSCVGPTNAINLNTDKFSGKIPWILKIYQSDGQLKMELEGEPITLTPTSCTLSVWMTYVSFLRFTEQSKNSVTQYRIVDSEDEDDDKSGDVIPGKLFDANF